jgi:hypothetical protein
MVLVCGPCAYSCATWVRGSRHEVQARRRGRAPIRAQLLRSQRARLRACVTVLTRVGRDYASSQLSTFTPNPPLRVGTSRRGPPLPFGRILARCADRLKASRPTRVRTVTQGASMLRVVVVLAELKLCLFVFNPTYDDRHCPLRLLVQSSPRLELLAGVRACFGARFMRAKTPT